MSKNVKEALALLLDDNLVWSADFEVIRKPLAQLLTLIDQSPSHQFDEPFDEIVLALSSPKVSEPLERWVSDAERQLGIYRIVAGSSESASNAIKRLFNIL